MAFALDSKLQEWRSRAQSSTANAYLRWWLGELKELMPDAWQQKLQHAMRRVTVELVNDQILIGLDENRNLRSLGVYALHEDADFQRQQVFELLEESESLQVSRVLLLEAQDVLRKEVRMPLAAESNLRQVLSFEMDRQTPFRAEDVYFDWLVTGHDKEAGQVRVNLVVVPRSIVDHQCQILAARGLAVSAADARLPDGTLAGVNVLPPELRTRVVNPRVRFNQILAAAAVALLAFVMMLSLSLRSHQVQELEEAIDEVRGEALSVQRIRDQINDTSESAGFLAERRKASPVAVDVLADVTRTLPDDTYLDRLVVGQSTVQMQGKSRNAQQLIELVNQSPLMEAAAFRGSTRLDQRTGLEIFEINANVEPKGGK